MKKQGFVPAALKCGVLDASVATNGSPYADHQQIQYIMCLGHWYAGQPV